ncbi:TetR/AcrR family transcriptional regulator [Mucilaginibacter sp.]|jgi:AcrR family transcriptional regulator|uniref:TetR/AcrR family transcriptional regulator n=1 Tax=Mucilaginibacter sp. TaxID=1882438 RepID=UPI003564207B
MTMERDKRSAIQLAAEKLFAKKGFQATSIRELGREAGVNSSMISYYFKSKQQLLLSIFERSIYDLSSISAQLADQRLTEMEKLNQLIDFYTAKLLADGTSTYIMLQEQLLRSIERSSQLSEEITEKQFSLLEGIVKAGITNGSFKPDINIRMIFYTLLGTFRQIVIVHSKLWLQDSPDIDPKRFQSDIGQANRYLKSLLSQMLVS